MHSSLLWFGNEATATCGRLLAYAGAFAALAAVVAKTVGIAGVEAAVDPVTRSGWITIDRPHAAFALITPEFAEGGYAIHRHPTGGGRKDIMIWGTPESSRLMVEIYRAGKELQHFADPASEITARLAGLGDAVAVSPAEAVDTKFGSVALVDFTARAGDRSRHCLGFVRAFDEPRLQIAGWYCNSGEEIVDHRKVACALDRLAVIAAGSDPKVSALFAHAELQRKFCSQKSVRRGATLKRADWIETARDPKLRGRHVTR